MKIGKIISPNQKGQVVIPKKIRDEMGITPHSSLNLVVQGKTICLQVVEEVAVKNDAETTYQQILEKTKGTWHKDSWRETRENRAKIELKASKSRKQA